MNPLIRQARPGDECEIHEAHMRSIREICIKDHGPDEIRGWGYRPLGNRWTDAIRDGHIWVVEYQNHIHGLAYIRIFEHNGENNAELHALYLTPDVLKRGLGLELATLMLDKAVEFAVKRVKLSSSITAHGFYKRLGFVDSGEMKKILIGGYPVTCYPMELCLN